MGPAPHRSGGKRRSYSSRVSSAIFAIALNIAVLCVLNRWIGPRHFPSPAVGPITVDLIFPPPRPHYESYLPAINPHLVRVPSRPPVTPPDLNIAVPIDVPSPPERSDILASYSPGNRAKPGAPAAGEALSEALVSGEQPGPALWEVTSVGSPQHVLWILGEPPTPLPAKVVWRSKQVEAVLAHAQEVILDGHIIFDSRTLSKPLQPTEYEGEQALPWRQTLKDVVPDDVYRRFNALKVAFAANDHEMERLRPWLAADDLRNRVLKSLGLTNTTVSATVLRGAWRAKVTSVITYPDYAEFDRNSKSSRTVSCLEKTVSELETDRDDLKRLANAWSVGDIEVLRELFPRQKPNDCLPALFDSDQQAMDTVSQHTEQWLAAVELALRTRQSSFALVPMVKLLAPDSWLTALQSRGYSVQGPRWQ